MGRSLAVFQMSQRRPATTSACAALACAAAPTHGTARRRWQVGTGSAGAEASLLSSVRRQ